MPECVPRFARCSLATHNAANRGSHRSRSIYSGLRALFGASARAADCRCLRLGRKARGVCELNKPSKILIVGMFAGALTYGLGEINTLRLERRVQELQRACIAERDAEAKRQGPLSALTKLFGGESQCDPVELARSSGDYTGIQYELAAAESEALSWDSWPVIACLAILVACSIP